MSAERLEGFLARLYVDAELRERFLADPDRTASAAGLAEADQQALAGIDRVGLRMAAASFASKRDAAARPRRRWWRR